MLKYEQFNKLENVSIQDGSCVYNLKKNYQL